MFLKSCFCVSFFLIFFSGCGIKEPFKEKSEHHTGDKEGRFEKEHYKVGQLPRPKERSL